MERNGLEGRREEEERGRWKKKREKSEGERTTLLIRILNE